MKKVNSSLHKSKSDTCDTYGRFIMDIGTSIDEDKNGAEFQQY
jgi:hypothetical protein